MLCKDTKKIRIKKEELRIISYLCRQNDKTKDIMRRILTLAVTALAALINIEAAQTIKAPKGGKAISDELLGIFFEDISYAADGGIYAELVQNRT